MKELKETPKNHRPRIFPSQLPVWVALFLALIAAALPASVHAKNCSADQLADELRLSVLRDASRESDAQVPVLLSTILQTENPAEIAQATRDFDEAVERTRAARSAKLKEEDRNADVDWPKDDVEYSFYVDQFGSHGKTGTFDDATRMIPYLKKLGVNLLYPLPFLESAGMDGGFDVIDYDNVDPRLGGNAAFERFMRAAKRNGMKVKMDLILNHVSDQNAWFQSLLKGDLKYKDYVHHPRHPS